MNKTKVIKLRLHNFLKMTRIGFKRFQPICLSIFGNVPGCCRPQHTVGLRQVSISVEISKLPCAVKSSQVHTLAKAAGFPGSRSCTKSISQFILRKSGISYTSHDPHRYGDSFSGCMCCPAILAVAVRLFGFVWQYRCVHWLIVAGTCSTPQTQNQVSRKSTQPQVLGIYIVTLILVFPHTRPSFHAIRPLFLCCDSTQIEMGPI